MSSVDADNFDLDLEVAQLHIAAAPPMAAEPVVADHGSLRTRRLRASVIAGLLIKPLALITPLVTTPLFVSYLGDEGYGLFQAVIGLAMLLSISNIGMQQGLINRLIDCHVSGDRALARKYVSSFSVTLGMILLAVLVAWSGVTLLVPWGRVFEVKNPESLRALPWIVWITGAGTLLGLYYCVPIAIYMAFQETFKAYIWDGVYKLAILAASVFVVHAKFGLIGVAVATAVVAPLAACANTQWLYLRRPWLRPRLRDFDRSVVRSLLGDGMLMFLLQMSVVAMFQCDKTLIGILISPEAVTPYALLVQLFVIAYGLTFVIMAPLMPAYGEAYRRGDVRWIRRALRVCLLVSLLALGGCGAALLVKGDWIFRVWGRASHAPPKSLILAVTALFLQRAWVDSHASILNPAGILRPQVKYFAAHVCLNLILAILLAKPFGVAGIAWATPITGIITTTWAYPWMVNRALGQRLANGQSLGKEQQISKSIS